MTLVSMTGFTRTGGNFGRYNWTWEIKTVNGKGLDLRLRLPAGFDDLDRPGARHHGRAAVARILLRQSDRAA